MVKRKSKKESRDKDLLVLILLVPAILLVSIGLYSFLSGVAKKDARVCKFLGSIWLDGVPGDSNVRKGCFTHEEIYSGD